MSDIIFDPVEHTYRVDENYYPSVTTILKAVGLIDDHFYTDEGRDRGNEVHATTALMDQNHINLEYIKQDHEYYGYFKAWQEFKDIFEVQFKEIEKPKVDKLFVFAGTPDRLCMINDYDTLLDIKTGAPEPWHELQLTGYRFLHNNIKNLKLATVFLCADGKYKYRPFEIDNKTVNVWWGALNVYNWKKANGLIQKVAA
jgi:hypothetical protein